jgi:hypothetical protein
MGLEHRNVSITNEDLDKGEKLIKLTTEKAFQKLMEGKEIFARFQTVTYEHIKGCRRCDKARKGNFCSECGSQLTDNLPREVIKDKRWLGLELKWKEDSEEFKEAERELWEFTNHPFSGGRTYKKSGVQLGYFTQIQVWYWRGY